MFVSFRSDNLRKYAVYTWQLLSKTIYRKQLFDRYTLINYAQGRQIESRKKKNKNLFPAGKYNIDTQNAHKHQIFITAYRRLPESFYKLSMLATYNT